jgi:hypothetical protein
MVAVAQAEVQLAEILADPASDWNGDGEIEFREDEWIEVHNTGPEAVDLTAYYIRDALGEEAHMCLFGILAPQEAAVFYGHQAVAWQQEFAQPITGFSLNNSGDTVELWLGNPESPDAQLVDVHIYLDHEAEDDRASGRMNLGGEWGLFDGLNPYNGTIEPLGTGCTPTPGVVNDCVPLVPNETVSWGGIKASYRD